MVDSNPAVKLTVPLALLGDDFVFDLVVSRLGKHLLFHQVGLGPVRTAIDDLLGISRANAGKRIQLSFGGGVDVKQIRRARACGRLGGGCVGLRNASGSTHPDQQRQCEKCDENTRDWFSEHAPSFAAWPYFDGSLHLITLTHSWLRYSPLSWL